MKTTLRALVATLVTGRLASAGQAAVPGGMGLLTALFLAFCVVIAVLQVLPAVTLIGSMVRELFAAARRENVDPSGEGAGGR